MRIPGICVTLHCLLPYSSSTVCYLYQNDNHIISCNANTRKTCICKAEKHKIYHIITVQCISSKQQFDMRTMMRCSKECCCLSLMSHHFLCDSYIPFHYTEQTHDCKPQCFIETTVAQSQVSPLIAHTYIMSVM